MEDNPTLAMRELLQRRAPKVGDEASDRRLAETSNVEEYMAFANGRIGTRTQLCVIFRRASGSSIAFSYSHLFSVESDDPAQGCTIHFLPTTQVQIRGQNLALLFDSLCRHRVAEIVEAPRRETIQLSGGAVVDGIEVVQGPSVARSQVSRQQ